MVVCLICILALALAGGILGTIAFLRDDDTSDDTSASDPAWKSYQPKVGTFRAKSIDGGERGDVVQPTLVLTDTDVVSNYMARYLNTGHGIMQLSVNFETLPIEDITKLNDTIGLGDYYITMPEGVSIDLSATSGEVSSVSQGSPVGHFYTHRSGVEARAGTTHVLDDHRLYFRVHKDDGTTITASNTTAPFAWTTSAYTTFNVTVPVRLTSPTPTPSN